MRSSRTKKAQRKGNDGGITELVLRWVEEMLRSGKLKAGSRLPPERELAQQIGVSRLSVSKGLRALSALGIIRAQPQAGTYIKDSVTGLLNRPLRLATLLQQTSHTEVRATYRLIVTGIAEQAAGSLTSAEFSVLAWELTKMTQQLACPEAFFKHQAAFINSLVAACGNRLAATLLEAVSPLVVRDGEAELEEELDWCRRLYTAARPDAHRVSNEAGEFIPLFSPAENRFAELSG